MSAPYTNQSNQTDAKLVQQRAMFRKTYPDNPLVCVPDVNFQALESAGDGPFSAIQEWIKNHPEIQAMIAVGEAFGPWVTAAGFVYGLYSDWQRNKQDKETAKKIIREVVAAVDEMINRAVENVEKFIEEEMIQEKLNSLKGLQKTLADNMTLSADSDFENIDTVVVGFLLRDCNDLLFFFEGIFHESIKASNSAQAALMYEHLVDIIQLKNQTLAWKDQTLPHGTSSIAKEGVLHLQELLDILLSGVRKTTNKQFSGIMSQHIELDNEGDIIRPQPGPRPPVGRRIDLFFYYFRGEAQGRQHFFGIEQEQFIGSTNQAEAREKMKQHQEDEYKKVTEHLQLMGDENKKALDELGIFIQEEAPTAPSS